MNGPEEATSKTAEALTGHLGEYEEVLGLLAERPGLVVLAGDPLSGTSALLAMAMDALEGTYVRCDARSCLDGTDLAMAIADAAVSTLAGSAEAWWMGAAAPASTAGLRISKAAGSVGIDLQDLQNGTGQWRRLLADAIELITVLDGSAALVVDHLGLMLEAMRKDEARELLGELRAARQRHPQLDLVLVEHSKGAMSSSLIDRKHPMFQAGQLLRIRRPTPSRFGGDLAVARAWSDVPVEVLEAAAELAAGVPAFTWRIIELTPEGEDVISGWRCLRQATSASTAEQWDLLRRVHRQAQPVVSAMGVGLRPHAVAANAKSVNDALNRLRGLGLAWQPEERTWSLANPLLKAWARDHAPSWALRRSGSG
jgi:hypothetical protein